MVEAVGKELGQVRSKSEYIEPGKSILDSRKELKKAMKIKEVMKVQENVGMKEGARNVGGCK